MFHVGDMVVYRHTGVCRVEQIGKNDVLGGDDLYYTLKPLYASGTIYIPVETKVYLEKVMSRETAENWIDRMPGLPENTCEDRRTPAQKSFYTEVVNTHDFSVLISTMKGLFQKSRRAEKGKKPLSATEEQFQKLIERLVYQELAAALEMEIDKIPNYIQSKLQIA